MVCFISWYFCLNKSRIFWPLRERRNSFGLSCSLNSCNLISYMLKSWSCSGEWSFPIKRMVPPLNSFLMASIVKLTSLHSCAICKCSLNLGSTASNEFISSCASRDSVTDISLSFYLLYSSIARNFSLALSLRSYKSMIFSFISFFLPVGLLHIPAIHPLGRITYGNTPSWCMSSPVFFLSWTGNCCFNQFQKCKNFVSLVEKKEKKRIPVRRFCRLTWYKTFWVKWR